MTEKRIKKVAGIEKVWNENGGENCFPLFRMILDKKTQIVFNSYIEKSEFIHEVDEGEQLLFCKKDGAQVFSFYVLTQGLALHGLEYEKPVFHVIKGENVSCHFDNGIIPDGLTAMDLSYTGQNYTDGETLMTGDITFYDEVYQGREGVKTSEFFTSKVGLEELLEYPDVILGRYYFYHENCNLIDFLANRKGGYKTRHGARYAAIRWIKKNG